MSESQCHVAICALFASYLAYNGRNDTTHSIILLPKEWGSVDVDELSLALGVCLGIGTLQPQYWSDWGRFVTGVERYGHRTEARVYRWLKNVRYGHNTKAPVEQLGCLST